MPGKDFVLLCDLDGVLRSFDRVGRSFGAIEAYHGLPVGAMMTAAFAPERVLPAITGRVSHDEWVHHTEVHLAGRFGPATASQLIDCWVADRGEVVPEVLDVVRELREQSWRVIVATNATSRLNEDLSYLRLHEELDGVVNSSDIGVVKPYLDYFSHAQRIANAPATHILFVDDREENVIAAIESGMSGVIFDTAENLRNAALAHLRKPLS